MADKLSIIIPARNEKYLQETIDGLFDRAEGELDMQVLLDGYKPDKPLRERPGLSITHIEAGIGQRAAYNMGVRLSNGNYIMKLDGHAACPPAFDTKLIAACPDDSTTVIPRMKRLNVNTWEPKRGGDANHMFFRPDCYLGYWKGYDERPNARDDVTDVMTGNGSAWLRTRVFEDHIGGLDDEVGTWGLVGLENALKTWLSGGRQVLTRQVWQAHWFREGKGFPYHMSGKTVARAHQHGINKWIGKDEIWPFQTRPFQWIIDKFDPVPWWDVWQWRARNAAIYDQVVPDIHAQFKDYGKANWRGFHMCKYPADVMAYQELIHDTKPDFIIELGTYKGGSTLFLADMLELVGKGQVVSVDTLTADEKWAAKYPTHDRIRYIAGDSTDKKIINQIKGIVAGGSVMVICDSRHEGWHVRKELEAYRHVVTKGQYMCVEDTAIRVATPGWGQKDGRDDISTPQDAIDWYMGRWYDYRRMLRSEKYFFTGQPGGWLKRIK